MDWQMELYRIEDPSLLLKRARRYLETGNQEAAATALDRAFGLQPDHEEVAQERYRLLESLAREKDGVTYRYVPGGYFLMGSETGDPDERPVHLTRVDAFWIAETPVDWVRLCHVLEYSPPPDGWASKGSFAHGFRNEIRVSYCENHTEGASDWHNHYYEAVGETGWPYRPERNEEAPHGYDLKPVVAVDHAEALNFCKRSRTCLPTEKQWEKAARGGLIGQPYAWGSRPPDPKLCDFHRFDDFSIQPMRRFPPNGYGLYAMCGGVWEWTSTLYDARAYEGSLAIPGAAREYVIRGGSWADCAESVTVSFRASRPASGAANPNQGLRVCLPAPRRGLLARIEGLFR